MRVLLSRRSLVSVSVLVGVLALAVLVASAWASGPPRGAKRAVASAPNPKVLSEQIRARTATSRTFLLSDGTRRTRIWTSPVNYRKADGSWAPIDTTLQRDGADAFRTTATGVGVELPRHLDAPVQVTDPAGRSVAFRLRDADAAPSATVTGDTATYAAVRPGVDATYEARGNGVKETLTLADATAPSTFSFALDQSAGLTPKLRRDGSVQIRDAKGATRFVIPAPTVQPADAKEPTAAHVAYDLSADGTTLTLKVDPDWLAKASFPVKVDPSYYDFDSQDCTLSDGALASTPDCGDTYLRVGNDGTNVQRAAIRFDSLESQGIPSDASIAYAQLYITLKATSSSTLATRLDVSALGRQLAPGATWATYNGIDPWDAPGGDSDSNAGAITSRWIDSSNVGYDVGFDVTSVAASWIHTQSVNGSNASTNDGLLVRAQDENVRQLASFGGPAYPQQNSVPALEIDWTAHTGVEGDQTYEGLGIDDRSDLKVNVATGNLAVESNDISIPGVNGMDLNLSRTYNSEDVGNQHMLGSAWTESINGAALRMQFNYPSHSHVLYANGGAIYRFNNADANIDTIGAPNLVAPPAMNARMVESSTTNGVTVTFPNGTVWTYSTDYSGWQELQQIKDVHGNHIDLAYSSNNDEKTLTSITDSYGHVLRVDRDGSGNVSGLTDATGRHWSYATGGTYHNLDSFTNPDSKTTTYGYDTSHPADIWDWMNQITDARGHVIRVEYNGATGDWQQVTKITRVVDGGANDVVWQFNYKPASGVGHSCSDTTNLRTVETDPRGKLTTYCHDSLGHVVESWDALNRKATAGYNAQGNVIDAASTAGGTGNPLHLEFARDSTHNLTGGTEPSGETFGMTYCMTPGSSANACTGGVRDDMALNRLRQYTDEQGARTDFDYNDTGDLLSVRADASPTLPGLSMTYNSDGTIRTSMDGNGNQTSYAYTNHNLVTATPPSSTTLIGPTTMTYDAENRLATSTDPLGTTATLAYDGEDRIRSVTYSNGRSWTMTYDANGNPTQRVEKNGSATVNSTTYTYDNLNRRTAETFPGSQTNGYGYDKIGNLVSTTDPSGTTTYNYDDINRLSSVTSPKRGTVDCSSSPTSCDAITYAYTDLAGAARTANGGATARVTATYPGSTLTQVIQANASGRMTSTAVKNHAGTVLQGFSYSYLDGGSQRALIAAVTAQPASTRTTYTYDSTNAQSTGSLTGVETKNSAGSVIDSWTYAFDAAGNRTRRVHAAGGTTTNTTFAYNAANELCWLYSGVSSNACASPPSGATTYSYDRAGNQTTDGMSYDALSRLTGVSGNALSYLTPGNDELVGYGSTSYQNDLLGLSRETPSSGVTTAYTRTPDGSPVAQRTSTAKQFLFSDQLGSVTALADDNADSLTRTYAYDPDGNRTSAVTGTGSGAVTNLGFAGGHLLPNGMYHFGARMYDPGAGRWTQTDPISAVASQTDANPYGYAGGNPVNFTDPAGTCVIPIACKQQKAAAAELAASAAAGIVGAGVGALPGVGPTTAAIAGGCAHGAVKSALTKGADVVAAFKGCLLDGLKGGVVGATVFRVVKWVTPILKRYT